MTSAADKEGLLLVPEFAERAPVRNTLVAKATLNVGPVELKSAPKEL